MSWIQLEKTSLNLESHVHHKDKAILGPKLGNQLALCETPHECIQRASEYILRESHDLISLVILQQSQTGERPQIVFKSGLAKNEIFWVDPDKIQRMILTKEALFFRDPSVDGPRFSIYFPITWKAGEFVFILVEFQGAVHDGSKLHFIQGVAEYLETALREQQQERPDSLVLTNIVKSYLSLLFAKDTYTAAHSERVALYAKMIGMELGLTRPELRSLSMSALIHDVGKIGIPDEILRKPTSLSHEEYQIIMKHPEIGEDAIRTLGLKGHLLAGVLLHHEKWDGSGYPWGLAGEEIPLVARIIALADALDAITSGRSYSGFLDFSTAIEELRPKTDLFDPYILQAFVRAHEKGHFHNHMQTVIRAAS